MDYLAAFFGGVTTFISPCILPMLPIYFVYFAGGSAPDANKRGSSVINSIGFVLGFSVVFIILGVAAGAAGRFLREYSSAINIVSGALMILFGLNYMNVLRIPLLNRSLEIDHKIKITGIFSAFLFGIVFSLGWTPCVGAFLGSILLLAADSKSMLRGVSLLAVYSIGLGIPFIVSAWLVDGLSSVFSFIKRHYRVINTICGTMLVLIGLLMMFGYWRLVLSLLTF